MEMNKKWVSMEDIAQRTGLSRATVSYVLNGRLVDSITEATRQKVLSAAREMGYKPNRFALALKNEKSHQVVILTPDLHPGFYSRILKELMLQLAPKEYEPRIVNAQQWSEAEWSSDAGFWPADGIIAFDADLSDANLAALLSRNTPVVCVGTNYRTEVDHVGVDLTPPAREVVRYLINVNALKGKQRRIAYLSRGATLTEAKSDARGAAYIAEMKAARLKPEFIGAVPAASDRQAAGNAVTEHVTVHGAPDAIFAYTDEFAIGAMAALRALNLRVPNDVKIIGCDGIEDGEYQAPPRTTIVFPYSELARLSWQFLQHRIAEPQSSLQSFIFTPKIAWRFSAGTDL